MALPGVAPLRGARAWNAFVGEVDPATGRMRWIRRIAGDTSQIALAADGSILVGGWTPGGAHAARNGGEDAMDALLSRFGADGRRLQSIEWKTPLLDNILGVAAFSNGGAGVLTNAFDGTSSDVATREAQRVVGFDAALRPTFEVPLELHWYHRLVESDVSDRVTVVSVGPTEGHPFQSRPDGVVPDAVVYSGMTLRVRTFSQTGECLGSRDLTVPGHAFAHGIEARRDGSSILLSGILGDLHHVSPTSASAFVQRIPDPGGALSSLARQAIVFHETTPTSDLLR
jgi:hypothetical protein